MRMLALLLCSFSLSMPALAHFKLGHYVGVDGQGQECRFQIKSVNFADGLRHPLNERVEIEVPFAQGLKTFIHLAIVDAEKGTARPKKEILSTVTAHVTGASAFEMMMNEQGPYKMVYIIDNYKDASQSSVQVCESLTFLGE